MSILNITTQLQYEGFLSTPVLWSSDLIFGMKQFELPQQKISTYNGEESSKLRLGKLVEQFVFHEFGQVDSLTILAQNIQIYKNKITIGELDCILKYLEEYIHLEIIYKFYLFDETCGETELEKWIGPNRNDSFVQKLTKLKTKQLPIFFHDETVNLLNKLNLEPSNFTQKIYFKAQLFVPLNIDKKTYSGINNACIKGFYIRLFELERIDSNQFYIPNKRDWLIDTHANVEWLKLEEFKSIVLELLNGKRAPLCWLKRPNGNTQKFFIVWWD
jgi:hypothetical protein